MTGSSLRHIAIIMDGNNRWAKQRNLSGVAGHKEGVERIRDVMAACQELHVETLTLFAFSSENWRRPAKEVDALMSLFQLYLKKEAKDLKKRGVRLKVIGNRDRFSESLKTSIARAEALTDTADAVTTLVIAADYGGRWDVVQAARHMAQACVKGELSPEAIDESALNRMTSLAGLPELDLLIRTGGEHRISNFLLWQAAYAELYFSDTLWPDFKGDSLKVAAADFAQRQRRFGRTSEQCESDPAFAGDSYA